MAKVEIDENEYAELQRVANVAKIIGGHEEARKMLQDAVALAAPDQAGPEIRMRKEVSERVGGIEKKLDEWMAAQTRVAEERKADDERRSLENRWSESRKAARESGYTEEGLQQLEEFMEKNGVADHALAIPAFERLHPPPEPVVSGGSRWNFFDQASPNGDAALKNFMDSGNDEQFLAATLPQALKDVRGGR